MSYLTFCKKNTDARVYRNHYTLFDMTDSKYHIHISSLFQVFTKVYTKINSFNTHSNFIRKGNISVVGADEKLRIIISAITYTVIRGWKAFCSNNTQNFIQIRLRSAQREGECIRMALNSKDMPLIRAGHVIRNKMICKWCNFHYENYLFILCCAV